MNKRWTFLFVVAVVVTLSIVTILNRPTEKDFKKWLQEEYMIDCNEDCSIIEVESVSGDITERIKFTDASGTYSPGIFTLRINRQYKSLDDPLQIKQIDVIGFNGRFYPLHNNDEF
ncbi:hypothetical protein [Rossellomorea vietnamensis]|uniref:Uncharacterized protein n=1 Tax=Rossellomorea vietnamensis TaxID=218284 RepID=A0A0P6W086_9BACI|nr:hypothetical protein [Rossellomorea vietnamensis]KPL58912.1 hypothetical protein AM506_14550 [Rossellomorea vietnamensis]